MGLHTILEAPQIDAVTAFDAAAFRKSLPVATAGKPFAKRRRTVDLGRDVVVSVTLEEGHRPQPQDTETFQTIAKFGKNGIAIDAPVALMQALLDAFDYDQDCDILPATALSLITEFLLGPIANGIEKPLGGALFLWPHEDTADAAPKRDAHWSLDVVLGGTNHTINLSTSAKTGDAILALFPSASPLPALGVPDAVQMPIALHGASITLPACDVDACAVGDVLMPEKGWATWHRATLTCDGHTIAHVSLADEQGVAVVDALITEDISTRSDPMTATAEAAPRSPNAMPKSRRISPDASGATLEQVNVTLSVEINRTEMSLGDLRQMTVGTVLPFDGPFNDQITLLVNGTPFATGELVQIDDQTGVRLSSLD